MTQKILVGAALVGALAALVISIMAWRKLPQEQHPLSGDDQPVTMAGGSLKMHSKKDWTGEKSAQPNSLAHDFKYNSTYAVAQVEWACSYDLDDLQVSTPTGGAAEVDITYSKSSTEFHTVRYYTQQDLTGLRLQMLKPDGKTVGYALLRTLVEFGEHPHSAWKATAMTSTGLKQNISCPNLQGDFYLVIHDCSPTGCQ